MRLVWIYWRLYACADLCHGVVKRGVIIVLLLLLAPETECNIYGVHYRRLSQGSTYLPNTNERQKDSSRQAYPLRLCPLLLLNKCVVNWVFSYKSTKFQIYVGLFACAKFHALVPASTSFIPAMTKMSSPHFATGQTKVLFTFHMLATLWHLKVNFNFLVPWNLSILYLTNCIAWKRSFHYMKINLFFYIKNF